ncbi:MAG: heme ABC transporter permease CcmB [Desulfovibrio sp.]|mgnify:CR=1 FL=1|nr:MAG: heme ABC transporter permease CcmB [Desulfovibrio sp.]
MIAPALRIAAKDLRLTLARGTGLVQALLLGLLLIFVFSLARETGRLIPAQGAAAIFWLASAFAQVLVFNTLYSLEESNGTRFGLLLAPVPAQAVWLGKGLAGLVLLVAAQIVFFPACVAFLSQPISEGWPMALLVLVLVDIGLAALGSLLGALAQGQASRESLLTVILFPLLIPALLAGIRAGAAVFSPDVAEGVTEGVQSWLWLALAFDALFLAAGLLLFPFVYSGEE